MLEDVPSEDLHIDYERLLETVRRGRPMGNNPVIVGSRPPNGSLWKEIKGLGFRVEVYDRSNNKEKEVDIELGASIVKLLFMLYIVRSVEVTFINLYFKIHQRSCCIAFSERE